MARKDRTGNRKPRCQRPSLKMPELGYYLVVTDTEATERCYFQGLHQGLLKEIQNKLVIKVVETKTRAMIDKCLEMTAYDAQYRLPWIPCTAVYQLVEEIRNKAGTEEKDCARKK